jgi:hypothetical protein
MEIYEVLEAQARLLLTAARQMRKEKTEPELTFPEQLAAKRRCPMSAADSVRLAFAYAKWSSSEEGKSYIDKHGDPYAADRELEIEATEWFAEREVAASERKRTRRGGLVADDIQPMMIFRTEEPPPNAGPDGQASRMQ